MNDCQVELIGLTDVGQGLLALAEHWAEPRLAMRVDPIQQVPARPVLAAQVGGVVHPAPSRPVALRQAQ
jgi:hypothetical protein